MKKDEIIKWVVGIVLVVYMIFQLYVSFSFPDLTKLAPFRNLGLS